MGKNGTESSLEEPHVAVMNLCLKGLKLGIVLLFLGAFSIVEEIYTCLLLLVMMQMNQNEVFVCEL